MFNKHLILILMVVAVLSHTAFAEMTLDGGNSTISFVSVKKSIAGEVHTFNSISGSLSDAGDLRITIDLNSVDTNIEIRDQRMKELLFETLKFPKAVLTAQLGESDTAGEIKKINAEATLDLHGMKNTIMVEAVAAWVGDQLLVTSLKPVIINVADFKLVAGVEKLREIASLPSIATAVPVSFVLVFNSG